MPEKKKGKKLVIANWKMNPATSAEATKLFEAIKKEAAKAQYVQTVICPPALYLETLKKKVSGHRCVLGAQNNHWEKSGAYTGEHSVSQLVSSGAEYFLIGHSERRAMGETNEMINAKLLAALKAGMRVVFFVGEHKRDQMGEFLKFVTTQLREGLAKVPRRYLLNLVVVYEPVWAISANSGGKSDNPENTLEMIIYIRKILHEIVGKDLATKIPILYGGSVNEKNCEMYLKEAQVDGYVVGGASLKALQFNKIINLSNKK